MIGEKLVPVYRREQRTLTSPCVLGRPCPTCVKHARCRTGRFCYDCRRGLRWECERATPAEPAFYLKPVQAITLVRYEMARFVNQNSGIQLLFSRVENMRGESCTVNERLILLYIEHIHWVRRAIEGGWREPPESVKKSGESGPIFPFI
jgi:hypothetical protein